MSVSEAANTPAGRVIVGILAVAIAAVPGCATQPEPAGVGPEATTAAQDIGGSEEGAESGEEGAATEPTEAPDGENAFCAAGEDIASTLDIVSTDSIADPAAYRERMMSSAELFTTVEPPANVEREWGAVSELLTLSADALADAEVATEDDVRDALSSDSEDAFFLVLTAPGFMEAIGVELQRECGLDLGLTEPAFDDACIAVDPMHLSSAFAGEVPEGESMRWAGATSDCTWDDGENSVGLTVSAAEVSGQILGEAALLDTVAADGVDVEVYDGAVGPFRASGGRTAVATVGETVVHASVRTGDRDAEQLKAIALAALVAQELE